MKKCDCYHIQPTIQYRYNTVNGDPIPYIKQKGVCWGTREQDICSCGGDRTKCDFYPEVRERALQEIKPEFGEWISVEERLPTDNIDDEYYKTVIIVLSTGKVVCGCYRNYDKEWWGDITDGQYSDITDLVTHWMPLPKPPKGE